jgi:hypothetical protein
MSTTAAATTSVATTTVPTVVVGLFGSGVLRLIRFCLLWTHTVAGLDSLGRRHGYSGGPVNRAQCDPDCGQEHRGASDDRQEPSPKPPSPTKP